MKKNGFTLVELLAVIIILGIIATLAFPTVEKLIKNSKEELYQTQIKGLQESLKMWAAKNTFSLPEASGESITITLGELKAAGFVEPDIKNPKTKKCLPNDMALTITKYQNSYIYEVDENSGTPGTNCDVISNAPVIILNGNKIEYVEIHTDYIEKGALAKTAAGVDITSNMTTTISGSGDTIDTSNFNEYTITYTVIDSGETTTVTRKVIVRDTTPPILTIPEDITINTSVTSFDAMAGVSATDNSNLDVTITNTHNISLGITGRYIITYTATDSKGNKTSKTRNVTIKALNEYKETVLNGAYPEIGQGMIPVTIENDGTVKKADIETKWYSYTDKKWANVVTVTEASRSKYTSAAAGTTIAEADILTYLVWIPRYKYQLWNVNGDSSGTQTSPFAISVVFENKSTAKSTGTTNGSWLTHPAFTFGTGNEINGYWVGKFETGYSGATSKASAQVNSNDPSKVVIKPNTYSWRSINVSNMFFTAQGMKNSGNVFGLSTSSDSHMMKNSEWGAVAYLSHSQYGTNKQVRINNNQNYMTGCAASTEDELAYNGCQNAWNTSTGYLASTTGNITGVYDMSGGAWEYVMGYTTGASTQYGSSEFTSSNFPASKYVDIYTATSDTQYSDGHLGDATKEVGPFSGSWSAWHQDYAWFVHSDYPWFLRGGYCDDAADAGAFAFYITHGGASSYYSFRVVVLGQ